jgi:hypothetical protein
MNEPQTTTEIEETIFTSEELAASKKLHPSTIRKMFFDQPGVIRMGHPASRDRRRYFTLRIPASVARRVFAGITVRGSE